jgi:hypothetical protein
MVPPSQVLTLTVEAAFASWGCIAETAMAAATPRTKASATVSPVNAVVVLPTHIALLATFLGMIFCSLSLAFSLVAERKHTTLCSWSRE